MKFKYKFLLGLAGYAGTSYFFLKNPNYIHFKKNKVKYPETDHRVMIIAHRGGSIEAPENTL